MQMGWYKTNALSLLLIVTRNDKRLREKISRFSDIDTQTLGSFGPTVSTFVFSFYGPTPASFLFIFVLFINNFTEKL